MKKKYQVFISSTYNDLIEERAAVVQCLLDENYIPVGMEQFPASNMSQMEYIEKMLDDCDYYILILAGKYGSCAEDGVSYTEKEYDYAISKGIPVMSFVIDDIGKLIQEKTETTEVMQECLKKFREKVCADKLVKFYSSIEGLKFNVITSLHKCVVDFPRPGWIRADETLFAKDLAIMNNSFAIEAATKVYGNEKNHGSFTFDYSNNNGEFTIGTGKHRFMTKWSKASDTSIHAYSDNVSAIARVKGPVELQSVLIGEHNFSSRRRTLRIGDIVIWKNENDKYAATKIIRISDDTRGADADSLTCEYIIYK